jgi:hypothetical protein
VAVVFVVCVRWAPFAGLVPGVVIAVRDPTVVFDLLLLVVLDVLIPAFDVKTVLLEAEAELQRDRWMEILEAAKRVRIIDGLSEGGRQVAPV